MRVTDPATSPPGAPTSLPVPAPAGPRPTPPRPGPVTTASGESADRALDAALAQLDGLGALTVHDHVEVFTGVDRALRERLAAAEG